MKRRSLNPNHIQAVSKEPVSGIMKAAIINHAGEGEGVRWEGQHHGEGGAAAVGLLRVGQGGLHFSTGRLGSSAAGQPAPQSRVTSLVGSVGKSNNSHNTVCLLIENDEQMAIACVGMADVNIQITLGISGEVWYLIAYLKLNVGDIKDEDGKFRS